jgi:hypothetical protein
MSLSIIWISKKYFYMNCKQTSSVMASFVLLYYYSLIVVSGFFSGVGTTTVFLSFSFSGWDFLKLE